MFKRITGVFLALTVSLSIAPQVFAQDSVLEEVTVTAQRREQNLQEVPIAVTAFTGADLTKRNITNATQYLELTPNVSFTEDGQSGSRGLGIAIRGINNLVSGENAFINSIGIYLDEFSVTSVPNQVANPFLPDMERVEVLRGPQGTYFGRNSVGGALNLTTKAPTDELEGSIRLGYESYQDAGNAYNLTGVLNLPLGDSFALRGVLFYEDSSGMVSNACATGATASCPGAAENGFTANGTADSGHEYVMGRLRANWDITDNTNASMTLIFNDETQGTDENVPSGILDIDSADSFGLTTGQDPGTGFWPDNQNRLSHDGQELNDLETTLAILNLSHTFGNDMSIHWISGIIDATQNRFFDNDLIGGADTLKRTNLYEGRSVSTELRLQGAIGDSGEWVVGMLYADDEQTQQNNVAIASNATATIGGVGWLPPFPEDLGLALNSKSFNVQSTAIFADYTWHINDSWDMTIGGRYTSDTVDNGLRAQGIGPDGSCDPGTDPDCNFFGSFVNSPRPESTAGSTFTDFAPRLAVTWKINDNVNLYGVASKGYKAGGNSVGNNTNDGDAAFAVPFDQETLYNYEIGVKSESADRRLRVNASVFTLRWNDMQVEAFRFLTPGDLSSNFEQTINVETAEATGAEVEVIGILSDNVSIGGSVGFLDTEITSDTTAEITGGALVELQGLAIPKAPGYTMNVFMEFAGNWGNSEPWVRAEVIAREGQYSDVEGLTNLQTREFREVGPNEFPYRSPSYTVWNLRGGFEWENWGLSGYIQNLTDEIYYTGTQENFGVSGIRLRPHPRVIGFSADFRF